MVNRQESIRFGGAALQEYVKFVNMSIEIPIFFSLKFEFSVVVNISLMYVQSLRNVRN